MNREVDENFHPKVTPDAALQAISDFGQWQATWESLDKANARIAELEAALDVALEALETCGGHFEQEYDLIKVDAAIAKLLEVRK